MVKIALAFAFLCVLTASASAQVSGGIGAHFTAANTGGNATTDAGLNFIADYSYKGKATAQAEGFARDGFPSRFRALAFATLPYKEFKFDLGGGYKCFGRCANGIDGAFGHFGVNYDDVHAFARFGAERFVEVEAAYDVAHFGPVTAQPFARFIRQQVCGNQTQSLYQFGTRFIFAESK